LQLRVDTHLQPTSIAASAAIRPFIPPSPQSYRHAPFRAEFVSPPTVGGSQAGQMPRTDSTSSAVFPDPWQFFPADRAPTQGPSREESIYLEGQSWERTGIIDPRWVSLHGTTRNTPMPTPCSGSPVFPWSANGTL
jgi:hypothetical protein